MINTAKVSSSMTNASRINIGETWDTDLNTWAAESRTWEATISIINNITRIFGGVLWAVNSLPWQLSTPWIDTGNITNISRPV